MGFAGAPQSRSNSSQQILNVMFTVVALGNASGIASHRVVGVVDVDQLVTPGGFGNHFVSVVFSKVLVSNHLADPSATRIFMPVLCRRRTRVFEEKMSVARTRFLIFVNFGNGRHSTAGLLLSTGGMPRWRRHQFARG